jgi:hypothetical protein
MSTAPVKGEALYSRRIICWLLVSMLLDTTIRLSTLDSRRRMSVPRAKNEAPFYSFFALHPEAYAHTLADIQIMYVNRTRILGAVEKFSMNVNHFLTTVHFDADIRLNDDRSAMFNYATTPFETKFYFKRQRCDCTRHLDVRPTSTACLRSQATMGRIRSTERPCKRLQRRTTQERQSSPALGNSTCVQRYLPRCIRKHVDQTTKNAAR